LLRERLRNFMIGRYGPDQLGAALLIAAIVFGFIGSITRLGVFNVLSYAFLIFDLYRMFSKNILKRRAENDRFIRFWSPLKQKLSARIRRLKARKDSRFFKCPGCKNVLRVPKGRGKIQITCPKCGERFIKKT